MYSLILDGTGINGTLPESIGSWAILDSLSFSNTAISGAAPLSMRNLARLRYMVASNTRISGPSWLASLAGLSNLDTIDMRANAMSGMIPEGFGTNLTSLTRLVLGRNSLTGNIPSSFARMKNLKELDLSFNQMNGTIPLSVSYQLSLRSVTLTNNSFSGCFDEPISAASACRVDSYLCGCTRAGCGLAICPAEANICSASSPFSGAVCFRGTWIIPSSVILQGANVSISSPTIITGDLVILTSNSTLSIQAVTSSSDPWLSVEGCITLNGLLQVSLNKSSLTGAPAKIALLTFDGFCNGNGSLFATLIVDTECGTLANARLDYTSRSVTLLLDGSDASACGGSAVSGLSPATLGLIIGCTLGGIVLIGIVVLVIAFTVPAVGNVLMPWRARRKLAGMTHSEL
jgi:hypothetical protein